MRSSIFAGIIFIICAFHVTVPIALFSNQTFYEKVTLKNLIDQSDLIAVVEKTERNVTMEKVSIGVLYPPFIKQTHHFKVIEVLFKRPECDADTGSMINVVMAQYISKLDIHTRYHKNKLSKSPIYESYQQLPVDTLNDPRFILFAKRHYTIKGYFKKETVPVKGTLEWTVENSYEILSNRERIAYYVKQGTRQDNTIGEEKTARYSINDAPVAADEFNAFLKTLREVRGTWFCAETNKGGTTGYDAVDTRGAVYQYRVYSESGNNRCTIKRIR